MTETVDFTRITACGEFPCEKLPEMISWNPDIVEHQTNLARLYREKVR